jgi:hypothetical protein
MCILVSLSGIIIILFSFQYVDQVTEWDWVHVNWFAWHSAGKDLSALENEYDTLLKSLFGKEAKVSNVYKRNHFRKYTKFLNNNKNSNADLQLEGLLQYIIRGMLWGLEA